MEISILSIYNKVGLIYILAPYKNQGNRWYCAHFPDGKTKVPGFRASILPTILCGIQPGELRNDQSHQEHHPIVK